jgi:chorismate-pyruvate lyase
VSFLSQMSQLEGIDLDSFGPLQRLLLVCDGTLTDVLEAALRQPIGLIKLAVTESTATARIADLAVHPGDRIMERRILLTNQATGEVCVYAESVLAVDRLPLKFYEDLTSSALPLGRLWSAHRLETFKELVGVTRSPSYDCHKYFAPGERALIARTYRVFCGGRPVMLISECFPAASPSPMPF